MTIKQFVESAEITFEPLEEFSSPYDDFEDFDTASEIVAKLEMGDFFAWFCAAVTAKVEINGREFSSTSYLGCCSYLSEKDFIENSGYYDDMVVTAKAGLQEELESLLSDLLEVTEL